MLEFLVFGAYCYCYCYNEFWFWGPPLSRVEVAAVFDLLFITVIGAAAAPLSKLCLLP